MKAVAAKIDGRDFLSADFLPDWIGCGVELGPNFQARRRRGCRDEVDNDLVANEGFTPPVLADEGEQPVLDFVPFTGAWRKVAHGDRDPELISELLNLHFPQVGSRPIATTPIRCNQQAPSLRVPRASHRLPPAAHGLDRERRRVVVDPHADPTTVGRQVIHSVGNGASQLRNHKIVYPDLFGLALRT